MPDNTRRVFTDIGKVNTMLELRKRGYSIISLATIYGVDHSTICYYLEKNPIKKPSIELQFSIPKIILTTGYQVRRMPLTYAEYLEQSLQRSKKRQMSQLTIA